MNTKPSIALMTYAIDGRLAKGTAIVARKAVEELLKRRDEFELTFIHYEASDDEIYTHGVREVLFPVFRLHFLNIRSLRQIYWFVTTTDVYDIVQWFQPRLYPFFWLAPAKRIVAWLHGAGDLGKENPFTWGTVIFNWTLKLFHAKLTKAIAGSDFARKDIIEKYGFTDSRSVTVIHNGAEKIFYPRSPAEIAAVKKKYNLPEKFLLNVARLNPGKNAFRVIRAFTQFASTHPDETIHFVNIGAKGSEEKAVQEFIERSGFRDRIHLVAYVETDDLPVFYCASIALIFPLLNEGFGLPAIEAMRCGTPVVVSNTSYPEITDEEALLVDALREESIAAAMKKMVEDEAGRGERIQNGFLASQKFTWEKMGERLADLYRHLLRA